MSVETVKSLPFGHRLLNGTSTLTTNNGIHSSAPSTSLQASIALTVLLFLLILLCCLLLMHFLQPLRRWRRWRKKRNDPVPTFAEISSIYPPTDDRLSTSSDNPGLRSIDIENQNENGRERRNSNRIYDYYPKLLPFAKYLSRNRTESIFSRIKDDNYLRRPTAALPVACHVRTKSEAERIAAGDDIVVNPIPTIDSADSHNTTTDTTEFNVNDRLAEIVTHTNLFRQQSSQPQQTLSSSSSSSSSSHHNDTSADPPISRPDDDNESIIPQLLRETTGENRGISQYFDSHNDPDIRDIMRHSEDSGEYHDAFAGYSYNCHDHLDDTEIHNTTHNRTPSYNSESKQDDMLPNQLTSHSIDIHDRPMVTTI